MNDYKIINFLRELADSMENKKLDIEKTIQVSEFYMSYKFSNRKTDNSEDDNVNCNDDSDNVNKEVKDDDFFKFIILGWYIYTFIIKDVKTTENSDENLGESVNYLD